MTLDPRHIRAALFDLDDTLLDRGTAFEATFREFYETQPDINSTTDWGEALDFFWSLSPHGTIDAQDAALRITERWPSVPLEPVEFEVWFFDTLGRQAKPIEGAMEFAKELNDANFPWAVVTNGKKSQVIKLEHSGYIDVVPFAIVSRLFGADKPDPHIYHEAVRRLKLTFEGIDDIQPAEILFVGDNPYTDITGAVGVGMKTAWVRVSDRYPDDAPSPDMEIGNVVELAKLFNLE